jgi:protein ImuB
VGFSEPSRDAAHFIRLLDQALDKDTVDAGFGIELLRLRAIWSMPLLLVQREIDAQAQTYGTSLAACLDRLTVHLGADAVRRPVAHASHIPERAQRYDEPLAQQAAEQDRLPVNTRPLKLLARPESIAVLYALPDGAPKRFRWRGDVHEVLRSEGPERIAPEWWRERGNVRLRDYYRIEDGEGRRYWIYRAGLPDDNRGGMPEWFLQGLFA